MGGVDTKSCLLARWLRTLLSISWRFQADSIKSLIIGKILSLSVGSIWVRCGGRRWLRAKDFHPDRWGVWSGLKWISFWIQKYVLFWFNVQIPPVQFLQGSALRKLVWKGILYIDTWTLASDTVLKVVKCRFPACYRDYEKLMTFSDRSCSSSCNSL